MAEHGYGRYTKGCRCEVCRAAKADYMRRRRAEARKRAQRRTVTADGRHGNRTNAFVPGAARAVVVAPGLRHGRWLYEEWGCRCKVCTAARSLSDRKGRMT